MPFGRQQAQVQGLQLTAGTLALLVLASAACGAAAFAVAYMWMGDGPRRPHRHTRRRLHWTAAEQQRQQEQQGELSSSESLSSSDVEEEDEMQQLQQQPVRRSLSRRPTDLPPRQSLDVQRRRHWQTLSEPGSVASAEQERQQQEQQQGQARMSHRSAPLLEAQSSRRWLPREGELDPRLQQLPGTSEEMGCGLSKEPGAMLALTQTRPASSGGAMPPPGTPSAETPPQAMAGQELSSSGELPPVLTSLANPYVTASRTAAAIAAAAAAASREERLRRAYRCAVGQWAEPQPPLPLPQVPPGSLRRRAPPINASTAPPTPVPARSEATLTGSGGTPSSTAARLSSDPDSVGSGGSSGRTSGSEGLPSSAYTDLARLPDFNIGAGGGQPPVPLVSLWVPSSAPSLPPWAAVQHAPPPPGPLPSGGGALLRPAGRSRPAPAAPIVPPTHTHTHTHTHSHTHTRPQPCS